MYICNYDGNLLKYLKWEEQFIHKVNYFYETNEIISRKKYVSMRNVNIRYDKFGLTHIFSYEFIVKFPKKIQIFERLCELRRISGRLPRGTPDRDCKFIYL